MKTFSFWNNKGGVGKTTLNLITAFLLSQNHNKEVLVIDNDEQGDLSDSLGFVEHSFSQGTHDLYEKLTEASQLVQATKYKGISIIPSDNRLNGTDSYITSNVPFKEKILIKWIRKNKEYLKRYDYVIIDSNTNINAVTINGLLATDSIVMIVDPDKDSYKKLPRIYEQYEDLQYDAFDDFDDCIKGLVYNRRRKTYKNDIQFEEKINNGEIYLHDRIIKPFIPDNARIRESKPNIEIILKNGEVAYTLKQLVRNMLSEGVL